MQVTDELIRGVVQQVLAQMRNGKAPAAPGRNGHARQRGVFADADSAVVAAREAQREFETRGLEDRILLVVCGEMGRTPKVNKHGGRDHWGNLGPLLLAGGGLRMGRVVGQSSRDGGEPATEPVRIPNLLATILHTLFDVGELRLVPGAPREVAQTMTAWEPIPGLLP